MVSFGILRPLFAERDWVEGEISPGQTTEGRERRDTGDKWRRRRKTMTEGGRIISTRQNEDEIQLKITI